MWSMATWGVIQVACPPLLCGPNRGMQAGPKIRSKAFMDVLEKGAMFGKWAKH